MAYKQQRTMYESLSDTAKASMILYLDQFPEHMETVHQIKESLRVPGSFMLDTYEAILLAALIREYWPVYADTLMAPLKPCRQFTPEESEAQFHKTVAGLQGVTQ